jgi:acetyltransferase-like isoleucine patch superfamily enzyme
VLIIDPSARISPLADIERSVRGTRIEIGARTLIDSFVKIKPTGGMGDCIIGDDCAINSGTVIYTGNGVRIADSVAIAANCTLAATNHAFDDLSKLIREQGFLPSRGGIVIEEDVWLGASVVVLDGAVIGKGSVVAAGSVVRGRLEPFSVYGGAPARRIRARGARDVGGR